MTRRVVVPKLRIRFINCHLSSVFAALVFILFAVSCSSKSSSPEEDTKGQQKTALEMELARSASLLKLDKNLHEAQRAFDKGLFQLATEKFYSISKQFPASPAAAYADLKVADAQVLSGKYVEARESYEEFLRVYPTHEAAAYASTQIANSFRLEYEGGIQDVSPLRSALKKYEEILKSTPNTIYRREILLRISQCKETLAAQELIVAEFYLKQGYPEASSRRLIHLAKSYPHTESARKAEAALESYFPDSKETKDMLAAAYANRFDAAASQSRARLAAPETDLKKSALGEK